MMIFHIMIAKTETRTSRESINSLVIYILRVDWVWFWLFSQYYFALSIKHLTTYLLSERVETLKVESMKLFVQTIRVRHFQLSNDDFWVWTERKIGQWIGRFITQLAPFTKEEKLFQYICDSVYFNWICLFVFWSVESLMLVCDEQILFRHL